MRILNVTQGTKEWLKAKAGVITGTRLKDVMGTKTARENLLNKIVSERLTEQLEESYTSQAMQRGIDEETFALKEYSKRTGNKISDYGLCLHEEYDWLGLSPDALKKDFTHAVESKSPNSDTHVKYIRSNKVPKEYHWQLIHYFIVNPKLKTLDFISYDARIKLESKQLLIINLTRKELQKDIERAWIELFKFNDDVEQVLGEITF